jgi:hypothetical protein
VMYFWVRCPIRNTGERGRERCTIFEVNRAMTTNCVSVSVISFCSRLHRFSHLETRVDCVFFVVGFDSSDCWAYFRCSL